MTARRRELGLSQAGLALACGLSRSYICDLERGRGKTPSLRATVALASSLRLDPGSLIQLSLGAPGDESARGAAVRTEVGEILRTLSDLGGRVRRLEGLLLGQTPTEQQRVHADDDH